MQYTGKRSRKFRRRGGKPDKTVLKLKLGPVMVIMPMTMQTVSAGSAIPA